MLQIFTQDPWPWWLGALGLAGAACGFCAIMGVPLGVSGYFRRLILWREWRQNQQQKDDLFSDKDALQAALAAATAAQLDNLSPEDKALLQQSLPPTDEAPQQQEPIDPITGALYLCFIVVGGLAARLLDGSWSLEAQPQKLMHLIPQGPTALLALFAGGILVGFGTSMAGGCTSGHGLSGCARFQPGSLVATATFFATAIAVAFTFRTFL